MSGARAPDRRRQGRRDALGWCALTGALAAVLVAALWANSPTVRVAVDAARLSPLGARGWVFDATPLLDVGGMLWTPAAMDSEGAPRAARHRLLLDGAALELPHAQHAEVAEQGGGRHSFWMGAVYFSTPDGGSPQGARIELELALRPRWSVSAAGLVGAGAALAWLLLRCPGRRLERLVAPAAAAVPIGLLPIVWFDPVLAALADAAPPLLVAIAISGAVLAWLALLADGDRRGSLPRHLLRRGHRLCLAVTRRWDGPLGRCAVLALVLLSLLRMWAPLPPPAHLGADVNPSSIFRGRIVTSDALDYWHGAEQLRGMGELSHVGARRPIHPVLLAAGSALVGGDRQFVTLLNAAIAGLVLGALAAAAGRCAGPWVALATLALSLGYVQQFVAYPLTEQTGFVFGALALVLLLDGFVRERTGRLALGSLLFGLAMMIRAGALFALAAPPLAAVLLLRPRGRALRTGALCGAMVVAAWACNGAVLRLAAPSGASANATFAYVALGMAMGGDWSDAARWLESRPEVPSVAREDERSAILYREAIRRVREDPGPLLGSLRRGAALFAREWCSTAWERFGERGLLRRTLGLGWVHPGVPGVAAALLGMLAVVRLCFRCPRLGVPLLLLVAGTLASMPVVWTDGRWRVLAPTMPLLGLVASLWLMPPRLWLAARSDDRPRWESQRRAIAGRAVAIASLLLAAAPLAAAVILPWRHATAEAGAWSAGVMVVPTPARLGSVLVGRTEEFSWVGPLRTTREGFERELARWDRDIDAATFLPPAEAEVAVVQALKLGGHGDMFRTVLLVADPAAIRSTAPREAWHISLDGFSTYVGGLGRLESRQPAPAPAPTIGEASAVQREPADP